MKHFFNPSSIAVVGASKHKTGHQILQNLRYGYKGSFTLSILIIRNRWDPLFLLPSKKFPIP